MISNSTKAEIVKTQQYVYSMMNLNFESNKICFILISQTSKIKS